MKSSETHVREEGNWPIDVAALLASLVGMLLGFQYTTLEKLAVLPPGAGFKSLSAFMEMVREAVDFTWADAVLPALMALVGASLVVLEIRGRRFSLFLGQILATEGRTLWGLGAGCLVLVRFYLARGQLSWGGDAAEHIAYATLAARSFAAGEFPIWTNAFGGGTPYLQFYGFLFFYLTGLVELVLRDLFLSLKLVLAAGHVASGLGMYCLVRVACRSRPAGFIAGLAYVLSFWHTQQVLIMGRLPLSLFYALLPWPFYCFERLRLLRRRRTALAGGGLALGGLALVHPGYAFWATVFLGLYVLLRSWRIQGQRGRGLLGRGLLMLGGGVALGANLTLPMWLERDYTCLRGGVSLASVPDPRWQHLLLWSNFRFRLVPLPEDQLHWYGGYLGLSLVVLAALGLLLPVLKKKARRGPVLAGGACFCLSLLLVGGYRWSVLQALPVIQAFNAGRFLLFIVFSMSLMAGIGLNSLLRHRGAGKDLRVIAGVLFIVMIDLGTTTFQQPYIPHEVNPTSYSRELVHSFAEEVAEFREGELPGFRMCATTSRIHPFVAISWLYLQSGVPSVQVLYNEAPLAFDSLTKPWTQFATPVFDEVGSPEALGLHPDAGLIYAGFSLLNVRYLLALRMDGEVFKIGWKYCTPLLVSPRIVGYPAEEFAELRSAGKLEALMRDLFPERNDLELLKEIFPGLWILRATGVHIGEGTCERIILRDYEGEHDLGTAPRAEVLEHRVWNQRVELRVRVSSSCYARLAYAYYPYLRVEVNEREVKPMQTAGGFISLPLERGEHRIVLTPYLSLLRRGLLVLDLVLLGGAVLMILAERRRERA